MKTFVTSDTHFYHDNIIEYCGRPFSSVEAMNARMIFNWNKIVGPEDDVYILGDFALMKGEDHEEKLERLSYISRSLNGKKHLIFGNHDYFSPNEYIIYGGFEEVMQGFLNIMINGHMFVMCHYQMTSWYNSHHGSLHLFGHEHWRQQYEPKHSVYAEIGWSERKFNVCADANKYAPVDINHIISVLERRPTNFNK